LNSLASLPPNASASARASAYEHRQERKNRNKSHENEEETFRTTLNAPIGPAFAVLEKKGKQEMSFH